MTTALPVSLPNALRQFRLLETAQLEEVQSFQGRFPEPKALAGELIRRGWLTPYQANQLLQGRGQDLLLGSYVLLERLGEGGMGEVFRARNWKLGKVVALKLIRKERLANPDAIRRFEREVRSAAALDHPNIVHAADAAQVGGTHLLVMEYVEGRDLSQLIKKNGPLPVPQACEYIRQAALGLQHAFERGLVHRDIKPANLLLTADGMTVKILDMGLARLDQPGAEDDRSSIVTRDGMVMGTPDYLSPEQAQQSHTVDIRADLYSLGCTFYYLLTGQPPFPGGSIIEKVLKHRLDEPKPVERLRPDVPPGVAAAVRKLLAKKPEDRYQTPAELAQALESVYGTDGPAQAASGTDHTLAEAGRAAAGAQTPGDTFASPFAILRTSDAETAPDSPRRLEEVRNRRLLIGMASGVFGLVGLVVLLFLLFKGTGARKPAVKEEDRPGVVALPAPKAPAKVDDAWLEQVAALPAAKQVDRFTTKLKELNPRFDGQVIPVIENDVVTGLYLTPGDLTDLTPVRAFPGLVLLDCTNRMHQKFGTLASLQALQGMKLEELFVHCTAISDLRPLQGMKLKRLSCYKTAIADLSPLKGMQLEFLDTGGTTIRNLSSLAGMPLTWLHIDGTPIEDLSPLRNLPLSHLHCHRTKVTDLSVLKTLPLKEIQCDFQPGRDAEILRSIKTLTKINGKPAQQFWKEVDEKQAAFEAWLEQVPTLPAEKQVEAVAAMLKERNPGFDGVVTEKIKDGVVTELQFLTDSVTDISPVRALAGLRTLDCSGIATRKGLLSDLSPLKDLKLTKLTFHYTKVSDLSPLKDMKLTNLACNHTKVSDLSPLTDMKLTGFACNDTPVTDLSPLTDMKLTSLQCDGTKVSNLSPLKDMNLKSLHCTGTKVSDLSPLKDMKLTTLYCQGAQVTDLSWLKGVPLKTLKCDFKPERDAEILRSIKTLQTINGKPAQEFWEEADKK